MCLSQPTSSRGCDRTQPTRAQIHDAVEWAGLSAFDRAVHRAYWAYCFDEAVCWPSQALIVRDLRELGIRRSQASVSRAVDRLVKAGKMCVRAKRWSPRTRHLHNVYEMLAPPLRAISSLAADRIVARGYWRRWKARWGAKYEAVNRNREVVVRDAGWRPASDVREDADGVVAPPLRL